MATRSLATARGQPVGTALGTVSADGCHRSPLDDRLFGLGVEEPRLREVQVEGPSVVGLDLEVGLDARDERHVAGPEREELFVSAKLDELDRRLDGRRLA